MLAQKARVVKIAILGVMGTGCFSYTVTSVSTISGGKVIRRAKKYVTPVVLDALGKVHIRLHPTRAY